MESAIRVQIQVEGVCISIQADVYGKGMIVSILPKAMER